MTEQVGPSDAYRIGWFVGELFKQGLSIKPVMINGSYTNAVDWRVMGPDQRHVTVRLVIDPDVDEP